MFWASVRLLRAPTERTTIRASQGSSSYNDATAVGTDNFQISLNGAASSANPVAVDLTAGDATAAAVTSTDSTATPLAVTGNNNTLNLAVNGTSFSVSLTIGGSVTKSDIANQINTVIGAQGTATVNSNNQIVITSNTEGAGGRCRSRTARPILCFGLATAGPVAGTSRTGASVAQALNQSFAANATLQAAGLTAAYTGGNIVVSSANGTYFRLDSYGSSASASVLAATQQGTAATAATTTGTTTSATIVTGSNDDFNIAINGGAAQDIFLAGGGGAQTIAQVPQSSTRIHSWRASRPV